MSGFRFDQQKIAKELGPGMRKLEAELERDYAEMAKRLQGQPLEEIKAELVSYFQGRGGEITEPELTQHAEVLRKGETITFNSKLQ